MGRGTGSSTADCDSDHLGLLNARPFDLRDPMNVTLLTNCDNASRVKLLCTHLLISSDLVSSNPTVSWFMSCMPRFNCHLATEPYFSAIGI